MASVTILVHNGILQYNQLYKVEGKAVARGFSNNMVGSIGASLAPLGGCVQVKPLTETSFEVSFTIITGVSLRSLQKMVDMFIVETLGDLSLTITLTLL